MNKFQIFVLITTIMVLGFAAAALTTAPLANADNSTSTTAGSGLLTVAAPTKNTTNVNMLPSDYLDLEVSNFSVANFSVSAFNRSSYQWNEQSNFGLPVGSLVNYTGYQFVPTNGTLYRINVQLPTNQSLLVYKDTSLIFNATRLEPTDVTFTITAVRPNATQGWSLLWGNLNFKANLPAVSETDVGIVVLGFAALLMFLGHRKIAPLPMVIGTLIVVVVGFALIGLIAVLAFVLYILGYMGIGMYYKRKQNPKAKQ